MVRTTHCILEHPRTTLAVVAAHCRLMKYVLMCFRMAHRQRKSARKTDPVNYPSDGSQRGSAGRARGTLLPTEMFDTIIDSMLDDESSSIIFTARLAEVR